MKKKAPKQRPDVFRYHDYRELLKDWLVFLKAGQSGASLRALSAKAGISTSNLSMIISGSRKLSHKAVLPLALALGLNQAEREYFELITTLGNSDHQQARLDAFERMNRIRSYRRANPKESNVFLYLTHWYYVAIREMSELPDFSLDPAWIQSRLQYPVDLREIEAAVRFLTENKFIETKPDGRVAPPARSLDCLGGVYRLALTRFHHEMLSLAGQSIEHVSSEDRRILGYTLAVEKDRFDRIQEVLSKAHEEIRAIAQEGGTGDTVYHVELASFPLTKPAPVSGKDSKGGKNE